VKKGKFLACELPSGRQGWVPKADVHEFREWAQSLSLTGENVVETALRFLGVPYMWGGTSVKEADCSGLARVAYMMNGLLLPRNASQQARIGAPADLAALEPGDLLLFGTPATDEKPARVNHVGIYIGDNRFIHSSQYVRISSLDPAQPDYYERAPLFARRIIGHVEESPAVTPLLKSPWYFTQN
jgi:cell wall-associated NlpC family hydrolase